MVGLRNHVHSSVLLIYHFRSSPDHVLVVMGDCIFSVFNLLWMYGRGQDGYKRKAWHWRKHFGRFPCKRFPLSRCNRSNGVDLEKAGGQRWRNKRRQFDSFGIIMQRSVQMIITKHELCCNCLFLNILSRIQNSNFNSN